MARAATAAGAALAVALIGSGCSQTSPTAKASAPTGPVTLTFWQRLGGALPQTRDLLRPAMPGGASGLTSLLFVTAVAARGNDVFVVDGGRREVLRIDRALQTISPFAALPDGASATGLYLSTDLFLYLVDPQRAAVVQLDRSARVVQVFREPSAVTSPVDVAVAEGAGRVLVADGPGAQVVEFNLLGSVLRVIGERLSAPQLVESLAALALGPDGVYLLDPAGRRVVVAGPAGEWRYAIMDPALKLPAALAVDPCNRVFVADQFDNSIHVFRGPQPLAVIGGRRGGLPSVVRITDLWVDEGMLYVADGPGGAIQILSIGPPCP